MKAATQFDILCNRIEKELDEYIEFCSKHGFVGRAERGRAFKRWLQENEAKQAIRQMRQEFGGKEQEANLRAACHVFDLLKQRDMTKPENWEAMCDWAEDVLWVLFALKDLDVKTAV